MATITPWEVSGTIDYDKIISEFGVEPMKALPDVFTGHVLFRRKKIFAHRDFGRILAAIRDKKPFVMMTGLMPTGKFHIGHMMLAEQIILYQKLGAKIYIAVADIEAFHARGQSLQESRKIAIDEYITNYIALGLKPENCEIYFQSERSTDAKRSCAFYRLQNLLARHATFNEFRAVYGEISPGKMTAALLQSADMLHPQLPEFEGKCPVLVPVGIDQDPHIRLARDITKRFKTYPLVQMSSTYHVFMPGLDGGKMSSSDPSSFIALTDTPAEVKKKINKYAFSGGKSTIEEHREHGGDISVDVAYKYLEFFFEQDDEKLSDIAQRYTKGEILSGEMKKLAIDKITAFLEEHAKRREKAKKSVDAYLAA